MVDLIGNEHEAISNPVTTSGQCLTFDYERKASQITLVKGSYKLEVWGAQGGDSAGNGSITDSRGKGGLGGYSTGIISLTKPTKFFIYVGGQGKTGDSQDGSVNDGGFPDG